LDHCFPSNLYQCKKMENQIHPYEMNADRSFDLLSKKSFRAVNQDGYMVDLIKAAPKPVLITESRQVGSGDNLMAVEINNLQWLLSAPKFDQIVIGEDGFPAAMVVPDPRAFAVYKLWLSNQMDRDAVKKKRDRSQALAIYKLILQYMPEFEIRKEDLRMFPEAIMADAVQVLDGSDLPPGYGE